MEKIKNLIKQQPLIFIVCLLAIISCFAILNAAPLISNKVGDPATLWIKQGVFYIASAVLIFIIYKISLSRPPGIVHQIYFIGKQFPGTPFDPT